MKSFVWIIIILSVIFIGLSAFSSGDRVELDERAFVVTLAVDYNGELFSVTAQCADPKAFAGDKPDERGYSKTGKGASVGVCMKQIGGELKGRLYLGHVKAIVMSVGEGDGGGAALKSLREWLRGDHELPDGTFVVQAKNAAELIENKEYEGLFGLYIAEYYKNKANVTSTTLAEWLRE